jgi:haloalkane dehalogenase
MDFVRTPDEQFVNLPDYNFEPNYVDIDGLRMHYVDEGKGEIILCMHGEPSWSYLYRKFIPVLAPHHRVICPDLFGFGKSDKPKAIKDYTFEFHFNSLQKFLDKLDLNDITIVVQDWGGLLGLSLVGLWPDRFKRLLIMNTFLPVGKRAFPPAFKAWKAFALNSPIFPIGKIIDKATARPMSKEVKKAYDAPFPGKKYKAGARAFPAIVPSKPDDPGVPEMQRARDVLSAWEKPAAVMFSDKDPIMSGAYKWFDGNIPYRQGKEKVTIENAGHFLQEDAGPEIAQKILDFMKDT